MLQVFHKDNCNCFACNLMASDLSEEEAIKELRKKEAELIEKYGWYSHYVAEEPIFVAEEPIFNAHTHGLKYDLQIVLPLPPETIQRIFNNLAEKMKDKDFQENDIFENIIEGGYKCKLIKAIENDRDVFRVILPDEAGNLDYETLNEKFKTQYE